MATNLTEIRIVGRDEFGAAARSVQTSLGILTTAVGRLQSVFGTFTVAALRFNQAMQVIQTAAAGFQRFKQVTIDSAEAMGRLAQQTGISVEALSALKFAAEISDNSIEALTTGLKNLSGQMFAARAGSKEVAALFAELDIDAGAPLQDVLLGLAERFAALPDSATKAALAVKLFGRSGLELIPFLNQGRDGIARLMQEAQRLGLVVTAQTAAAADEINDNLARLQANARGLAQQFGAQLTPVLLDATNALLEAKTQAGGLDESVRGLVTNRASRAARADRVAAEGGAVTLRHPHLDTPPQGARGRLDLIEARGMVQIEQPIHLRQMPAQTARQIGFAQALLGHRPIDPQLGALQRARAHRRAPFGGGRQRQRLARIDVERQRGFQRIHRLQQRLVFIRAEGDGLGHIGEADQHGAIIGGQDHWVVEHAASLLQSKLAFDGGFQPPAQFGAAVHRQRGLTAVQEHFQMRAFARRESRALLLQPLLHLLRVHGANTKHFCCVCQETNTTGMLRAASNRIERWTKSAKG